MSLLAAAWPWALHPHPLLWSLALTALAGYVLAVRRWTGPGTVSRGLEPGQAAAFVCSLAVLLAAAGWPIGDLAARGLLSGLVLEHLLLALVVAPLGILALPDALWRRLFCTRRKLRAARMIARPWVALPPFNLLIVTLHLPGVIALQVQQPALHGALVSLLLVSAMLMWWPVLCPLPEAGALDEPRKMLYLFVQSIALTFLASWLAFAPYPLDRGRENLPWSLPAGADQTIAGVLVVFLGGVLLWLAIGAQFLKGQARQESEEEDEIISWEAFERELETWDLRH
jgi:putative membrane protein